MVSKLLNLPDFHIEVINRAKDILGKLEDEKSIEIDKLFDNYINTEKELKVAVTKEVKCTTVEIKEDSYN